MHSFEVHTIITHLEKCSILRSWVSTVSDQSPLEAFRMTTTTIMHARSFQTGTYHPFVFKTTNLIESWPNVGRGRLNLQSKIQWQWTIEINHCGIQQCMSNMIPSQKAVIVRFSSYAYTQPSIFTVSAGQRTFVLHKLGNYNTGSYSDHIPISTRSKHVRL